MLLKEDMVMRTYDYAPVFRSTIGFDRILEMLDDSSTRPGWPLINVEKTDGDRYHIKMAIAGFSPQEVDVTQQGNTLTVTGQKTDNQDHAEMLHQGIADLENGLLSIDLVREVPEELRPRRIHIGARSQDNRPKQQPDSERQSKAA